MSHQEIEEFFAKIPEWMKTDIRREIQLSTASRTVQGCEALRALGIECGGGNLLAALGLVAYTEALGRISLYNRIEPYDKSEDCFLAFFDEMAERRYGAWRRRWEAEHEDSIYEVLRCGLVHEYKPKVDSNFWIAEGDELGLAEEDGRLTFKVEPYLRHFTAEVDVLRADLAKLNDPRIPLSNRKRATTGVQEFTFSAVDAVSSTDVRGPVTRQTSAGRTS